MTYEEFLSSALTEGRSTPHGYHFFQLFNTNKWEWFTRWYLGIRPKQPSKSLILGSAVHKALDLLYTLGPERIDEFLKAYFTWAEKHYNLPLQEQHTFAQDMLYAYLNTLYKDQSYLTTHTEFEQTFTLPNGFPMTCRIDRIVKDKDGNTLLVEVKTTGWSVTGTATQVALEDQVTAYLYATQPTHAPQGVLLEVLYRNPRGGTPTATRPTVVHRSPTYLSQWAIMMSGVVDDLYGRLKSFKENPTIETALYLFPRNGEATSKFGDDYSPLWIKGYSLEPVLPDTYVRSEEDTQVVLHFMEEYEQCCVKSSS